MLGVTEAGEMNKYNHNKTQTHIHTHTQRGTHVLWEMRENYTKENTKRVFITAKKENMKLKTLVVRNVNKLLIHSPHTAHPNPLLNLQGITR